MKKTLYRLFVVLLAFVLNLCVTACSSSINLNSNVTDSVVNGYSAGTTGSLSGNTINVSGKSPKKSSKTTPSEVYSVGMRGIDANDMPIGGFIGPNDMYRGNGYKLDSIITDATFKKLADCGINYIVDTKYLVTDHAHSDAILNLADKYNIALLMRYDEIVALNNTAGAHVGTVEEIKTALEPLLEHKMFAGLYGRDEPTSPLFPYIKQALANFYSAKKALNANDLMVYVNLFPQVGGVQLSGGTNNKYTYSQYLSDFYDCNPEYLMFDSYPITGIEDTVSSGWFNYIAMMNDSAKSHKVPWWGYAQAGGNFSDSPGQHRITNENELNYDVYTMLAFGAKGINYFPGVCPPEWGNYILQENVNDNSLINKYGNTTPIYYYAQKINNNIKVMAPVLMNSAHIGTIFNGEGVCSYGGSNLDYKMTSFRQLKSVTGDASVVGCFDYNGSAALLVVNNSLTEHRGEITLNFDGNYEYRVIQRATDNNVIAESFTLTLEAGEGALVVIK